MNIFTGFVDKVKQKKAELDERREFLDMVENEVKPLRRAAYMKESIKQSVHEGVAKAKLDAEKRIPKKKKTPEELGIKPVSEKDKWAFLDEIGKQSKETPKLTIPKNNITKSIKKKKK